MACAGCLAGLARAGRWRSGPRCEPSSATPIGRRSGSSGTASPAAPPASPAGRRRARSGTAASSAMPAWSSAG
eukprot:9288369-Lingulodinium_polyedra.AAC.1